MSPNRSMRIQLHMKMTKNNLIVIELEFETCLALGSLGEISPV